MINLSKRFDLAALIYFHLDLLKLSTCPLHSSPLKTAAVDVFSAGCVFYYVVSRGQHPFGDALRRQVNILAGEYTLSHFMEDMHGEILCGLVCVCKCVTVSV